MEPASPDRRCKRCARSFERPSCRRDAWLLHRTGADRNARWAGRWPHNGAVIPPPLAPDAAVFRTSTGRAAAGYAGMTALVWLFGAVVTMGLVMLLGRPVNRTADLVPLPLFFLFSVTATTTGISLGTLIRSPHWVRLSAAGMEIGTTDARAVLIPWSNVESATVHGRSVLAHLHVVPRRPALTWLQDTQDRLPPMRKRGGRRGYTVQVGLFPGGAGAVAAALRARGVPEARPPRCRRPGGGVAPARCGHQGTARCLP
jgi:hypothetical protein